MFKRFRGLAITGIAVAVMASSISAQLVITEAMPSSGNTVYDPDWWELTNAGAVAVDLDGYYWDDDPAGTADGAIFPSFILGPGESVVLVRADAPPADSDFNNIWCSNANVLYETDMGGEDTFSGLSSGGDSINLWDSNPVMAGDVPVASVTFGAATEGVSFEWGTNGNSLGLSALGENGAVMACDDGSGMMAGTDIGSPGSAVVPEPTGLAMIVCLLLGLAPMRRR